MFCGSFIGMFKLRHDGNHRVHTKTMRSRDSTCNANSRKNTNMGALYVAMAALLILLFL